jgi:hypothetical protein
MSQFDPRAFFLSFALMVGGSVALSLLTDLSFFAAFAIVAIAVLVNGLIIGIEDKDEN